MRRNPTIPLKEEVKYGHGFFRGEKCPLSGEDGVLVMSPRHLDQVGRIMAVKYRYNVIETTLQYKVKSEPHPLHILGSFCRS